MFKKYEIVDVGVIADKRYIVSELGHWQASAKAMMGRSYIVGEGDSNPRCLSKAQLSDETNRGVKTRRKGTKRHLRPGRVAGLRESRLNRRR